MSLWCGWVDVHRSKRQRRVASERYWADVSDAEVVFYSAQQPAPEAAAEHGGGGGGGGTPPVSQRRAHIRWDTVEEVVAEVPRGVAAFFEVADEGAAAATAGPRSGSPRRRHHVGLRSGEMWVVVRLATLQDARRWQDIHRLFASAPTVAGSGGGAEAIAPAVATADSSSPPSSPSPKHLPPSFSSAAATPPSARVSLRSVSPPAAAAAAATAVSGTPPEPLAAVLPLVTQYKTLLKAKLLRAENLEDLFAAESVAFPNLHGGSGGGAGGGAREEGEEGGLRFFPTCRDAVLDRLNRSRFEEAARTISTLRLRCAALEEEKDGLRRRLASAEAAAAAAGGGGGAVAALQETLASERRQHAAAEQAWGVERRSFECKLSRSEAERGAVAAAAAAATSPLPSPRGLSARASSASHVSPLAPPQPVAATMTATKTLADSATPSLLALPLLQQTASAASTDIEPRPLPPPTPHAITPVVSPALLPSQGAAGRGVTAGEDVEAYATCHVCGNHHPATALAMHLPSCLRAWYAAQKTVPIECRQVRPPSAPSGVLPLENLPEYNRLAHQVYLTQARNRCSRCLMRFDAPTLAEHLAVCGVLP